MIGILDSVLLFGAPLLQLAIGLIPVAWVNARPRWTGRMAELLAASALVCAILASIRFWQQGEESFGWMPSASSATRYLVIDGFVNHVTLLMLLLVSFVGVIVTRYSRNYLDGDHNQGRFHKWLALTLSAILWLIVSGNLLMFALAWMATSLSLHQLLVFYPERPAAVLAAHKKFVASRLGDLSLLTAVVLIATTLHTLSFGQLYVELANWQGDYPAGLRVAALLVVLSAGLKSAQFPFHGWLIQVMEAPTPVSALLHAGIVNAGAFLVIRMSPVMAHAPVAQAILVVVGLVTLALASLVMLTQTSIKVSLAWSTTAQMGFMLLECGFGLYSLAMLHLIAHSLYKAHAFLSSGSGVDAFRGPVLPHASETLQPLRMVLVLLAGSMITYAIAHGYGIQPETQPGLLAVTTIIAIAVSQLLLQSLTVMSGRVLLSSGVGLAIVVAVAYFGLHQVFEGVLQSSVMPVSPAHDGLQTGLALTVVAVFMLLFVVQEILRCQPAMLGRSVWVHLYNGLYIDVYFTRMLQKVWPAPTLVPETNQTSLNAVRS